MKTIGIIGGMGPSATYDFANKIVASTVAHNDQENLHVCIDCNTNIPDRTNAILHGGPDPLPEMVKSALRLQGMGAELLVMPCNTAHYFYEQILSFVDVPLLHMPRETAKALKKSDITRAGILSTDGTRAVGIYDKALNEQQILPLYPSPENQRRIMQVIYERVKAGVMDIGDIHVQQILEDLQAQGAQALVLACTELPLAFTTIACGQWNFVDPTEILARAAVLYAGGTLRNA